MKSGNPIGRSPAAHALSQRVARRIMQSILVSLVLLLNCAFLYSGEGTRRALLVGINDYINPKIPDLRGTLTDIFGMAMVLKEQFGFAEDQIQILSDHQATRAAILSALKKLVEISGPNDTIYFHFSGHGSQVRDLNGDEPDRMDETIVPADGRMRGVPDIIDDEIGEILSRLKTAHVVLVFDSCHSGTITRGFDLRARTLPPDTRLELYGGEKQSRAVVALEGVHYILLTGAADTQSALDGPVPGLPSVHCGYFSYALIRTLSQLGPGATAQEIHAGIKQVYASLREGMGRMEFPEPQLECPTNRLQQPWFSTSTADTSVPGTGSLPPVAAKPFVDVRPYSSGHVLLVRGALMDGAPDSKWAIFPADERQFKLEHALAIASVTEIHVNDSIAELRPADASIPPGARAILIAKAPPPNTIPIHVSGNGDMKQRLEEAITRRMPTARIVGTDEFARFVIGLEGETEENKKLILYSAGGLQEIARIPWSGATQAADALVPYFTRNATAEEITSLQNPSSGIKLDVGIVVGETSRDLKLLSEGDGNYHIRQTAEQRSNGNSLMLSIRCNLDCYITVVDVDSEGHVVVLFPNALQPETFFPLGRIPANQAVTIPDSLSEPNKAGFYWDYGLPGGMETVHVLASTSLEIASTLRRYIREFSSGVSALSSGSEQRGGLRMPSALDRLRGELTLLPPRSTSTAAATRAVADPVRTGAGAKPSPDWTGKSIMIRVEK
ncbi:MAG TPA: caspase family protein [Acidobacteriota bacterium]|nr:caspase family protein [Acidobacteriota bacterium]